jgi:hypothetical protein
MTPLLLGAALAADPCLVVEAPLAPLQRFRGEPDTPALRDARARLPPDMQQVAEEEAHAATSVQCDYRVRVGASTYRVSWTWDTTLEDKPDTWCAAAVPEVQAALLTTTRGCTDLQASAWWGHGLTPIEPPSPKPPKPSEERDAVPSE